METSFTSGVCECFDFSVVEVTTTIEYDFFNVGVLGARCDEFADFLGRSLVRGSFFYTFIKTGSGTECVACYVIDELCVNVLV